MASRVARKRREIKRRFLTAARSELGYTEGRNNDTKYGRWYGLNHQPWCGMWVSYVADKASVNSVVPKFAYTPAGADYFKKQGRFYGKPKVGDIAFYDTAGLGRISHVGIVEKVFPDGSWYSLEGNTNAAGSREGTVSRRQLRRTTGPKGGFGHPQWTQKARGELKRGV